MPTEANYFPATYRFLRHRSLDIVQGVGVCHFITLMDRRKKVRDSIMYVK